MNGGKDNDEREKVCENPGGNMLCVLLWRLPAGLIQMRETAVVRYGAQETELITIHQKALHGLQRLLYKKVVRSS